MNAALKENPIVKLKQLFVGDWKVDKAEQQINMALRRYPHTSVIWAANDPMAIGAMRCAQKNGKQPGKDILIGGLNGDTIALEEIVKGHIVTSVGGHFMTGGWGLVVLYDYHHGIDFVDEGLIMHRDEIFGVIDTGNVLPYLKAFETRNWDKIDFKQFTKTHQKNLKKYNFSINAILEQIR